MPDSRSSASPNPAPQSHLPRWFHILHELVEMFIGHEVISRLKDLVKNLAGKWETSVTPADMKYCRWKVTGAIGLRDESVVLRALAELNLEGKKSLVERWNLRVAELRSDLQDYYRLTVAGIENAGPDRLSDERRCIDDAKDIIILHADMSDAEWAAHCKIMNYDLAAAETKWQKFGTFCRGNWTKYVWPQLRRFGWMRGIGLGLLLWVVLKSTPAEAGKAVATARGWGLEPGKWLWEKIFTPTGKGLGEAISWLWEKAAPGATSIATLLRNCFAGLLFLLAFWLVFGTAGLSTFGLGRGMVLLGLPILTALGVMLLLWVGSRGERINGRLLTALVLITLFAGGTATLAVAKQLSIPIITGFAIVFAILAARAWKGFWGTTLGYGLAALLLMSLVLPAGAKAVAEDSLYAFWGYAFASQRARNTQMLREKSDQEFDATATYAELVVDVQPWMVQDGKTKLDTQLQRGDFVQMVNARPEPLSSDGHEPPLQVRLPDKAGTFSAQSVIAWLPKSVASQRQPEEYRKWLSSRTVPAELHNLDRENGKQLLANALAGYRVTVRKLVEDSKSRVLTDEEIGQLQQTREQVLKLERALRFPEQQKPTLTPTAALQSVGCGDIAATAPPEYVALVDRYLAANPTVPRALVLGTIQAESQWNPRAISSRGAMGLMQLMPQTAAQLGVSNPYDPEQSIRGGIQYLAEQLAAFGSTDLALAAYNWGPEHIRAFPGKTWADITPFAPPETQDHVRKVVAFAQGCRSGGGMVMASAFPGEIQGPPAITIPTGLRSADTDSQTPLVKLAFNNHSREPVWVYWVDETGHPVPVKQPKLAPGGAWYQPAYVGQVFVVADQAGRFKLPSARAIPSPSLQDEVWDIN